MSFHLVSQSKASSSSKKKTPLVLHSLFSDVSVPSPHDVYLYNKGKSPSKTTLPTTLKAAPTSTSHFDGVFDTTICRLKNPPPPTTTTTPFGTFPTSPAFVIPAARIRRKKKAPTSTSPAVAAPALAPAPAPVRPTRVLPKKTMQTKKRKTRYVQSYVKREEEQVAKRQCRSSHRHREPEEEKQGGGENPFLTKYDENTVTDKNLFLSNFDKDKDDDDDYNDAFLPNYDEDDDDDDDDQDNDREWFPREEKEEEEDDDDAVSATMSMSSTKTTFYKSKSTSYKSKTKPTKTNKPTKKSTLRSLKASIAKKFAMVHERNKANTENVKKLYTRRSNKNGLTYTVKEVPKPKSFIHDKYKETSKGPIERVSYPQWDNDTNGKHIVCMPPVSVKQQIDSTARGPIIQAIKQVTRCHRTSTPIHMKNDKIPEEFKEYPHHATLLCNLTKLEPNWSGKKVGVLPLYHFNFYAPSKAYGQLVLDAIRGNMGCKFIVHTHPATFDASYTDKANLINGLPVNDKERDWSTNAPHQQRKLGFRKKNHYNYDVEDGKRKQGYADDEN